MRSVQVSIRGSKTEDISLPNKTVSQYKIKTFKNKHIKVGNDFKAEEGGGEQIECAPEEPLLPELRAFVQSVSTRQAPRADGWAGYDSVRVLEAAMEAAKNVLTVELK